MPIHIESDKDTPINPLYLEPDTRGSGIFLPGAGTSTVYLDTEFRDGYTEELYTHF